MLPIHWEAQEVSLGSVLLCWCASVSERIGEPLELSLMLAFTYLSVCSRTTSPFETSLAPTAHEEARMILKRIAPLMLARLLGRVPLPLPDYVARISESEW